MATNSIRVDTILSGKPPIVLTPGWAYPVTNEVKFVSLLSEHFDLHIVQLPGYAGTPDSNKPISFKQICEELHAYLTERDISPAGFVGSSMGCRIIETYLRLFPNDIPCVFVGSPIMPYRVPWWARILLSHEHIIRIIRTYPALKQHFANTAIRNVTGGAQQTFSMPYVTLTGAFDSLLALIQATGKPLVPQTNMTFVYGSDDPYMQDAQKIGLKPHVVKGAPHNCVHGYEEEVVSVILRALHQ